jgi:hypothetical protein
MRNVSLLLQIRKSCKQYQCQNKKNGGCVAGADSRGEVCEFYLPKRT